MSAERITEWYDRQRWDTLVLIGLSPLLLVGAVLMVVLVVAR